MRSLFDPDRGIGVSFLRQPVGSSDFTAAAAALHLRRRAARADRLRAAALQHRPRRGADPAAAAPGQAAQPAAEGDGDAVEPAGLDEDQRLAGRRPAQGRPGGLRRVRALPGQVRAGLRRGRRADRLPHRCRTSRRTATPSGYPGTDMPVRQQAAVIEALGPLLRAASPRTKILALRPQLGHPPRRHRVHAARRGPGDRLPVPAAGQPGRASGSPARRTTATPATRARRPRCTRRSRTRASGSPSAPARTAPNDTPAQFFRDTLTWHARTIVDRHHPQLGEVRRQLEHRARPDRRPAPRRLRHLHRAGHRAAGRHGHHQRRVLHDRAPVEVRAARRGPDRQHVVRHHRLERADHGRRVPQPGRLHRARRAQRERRPAHLRGRGRRPAVRVHAARRRAGHLHLAAPTGRCAAGSQPVPLDGRDRDRRAGRRGPGRRGRRRRVDPLEQRAGAGSPGSTCRSTSAGRQRSAGSRSTAAATSATTPAAGSCRPATTASRWRRWRAGTGTGQLTNVDVRPHPRPLPARHLDRAAPATGGASPTCASTPDRRPVGPARRPAAPGLTLTQRQGSSMVA